MFTTKLSRLCYVTGLRWAGLALLRETAHGETHSLAGYRLCFSTERRTHQAILLFPHYLTAPLPLT